MKEPRDWKKMTPDEIWAMPAEEHEAIDDVEYHALYVKLFLARGQKILNEILAEHEGVFTKLGKIDNKEQQ